MQLTTLVALLLSAATGTAAEATHQEICMKNYPNSQFSIPKFCNYAPGGKITVPSDYAHNGYQRGDFKVRILGQGCYEPHHISPEVCRRTFWEICADSHMMVATEHSVAGWHSSIRGCALYDIEPMSGGQHAKLLGTTLKHRPKFVNKVGKREEDEEEGEEEMNVDEGE